MRPPFAYYGGKTGLAHHLIALMPAHRTYIEPFFGSGSVFFAKRPVPNEIINDLDGGVVTFFRVLRERPEELAEVCRLTPHARDEYRAAQLTDDLGDLERARRFWVRVNQSFGKTAGRQTGFSVTTARSQSVPGSILGRIERFHSCARRLMLATIENCDAAGVVERFGHEDTLVYADPPYLGSTRRGRDRQRPGDYLHDMGGADEHVRLAEVLHATTATVVLSGYPSPLYEDLYGDWWHTDFAVIVHASNSVTASRGERTERVWSNRPLGEGRLNLIHTEVPA